MSAHAAVLPEPGTRALTLQRGYPRPAATAAPSEPHHASDRGLLEHVWVDETRPLLQGARLTAWELETAGIPHAVIADSAAASLMARGEVDCVVTGADRIAANGDTANKIGTYSLAVLARHHEIPLYIVARVDRRSRDAERRCDPDRGARSGRDHHAPARNPAFDVTPADLTAIVTELGALRAVRRGARPAVDCRMKALIPPRVCDSAPSTDRDGRRSSRSVAARSSTRRGEHRRGGEIDEVHVVTNARKAPAFTRWAEGRGIEVHDDGTSTNDDRLGAVGDQAGSSEQRSTTT
jgi:hypothetical protein